MFLIARKLPFFHVALPSATNGLQIAKLICIKLAERKVLGRSHGERVSWARSACDPQHFYYIPLAKTQSYGHT